MIRIDKYKHQMRATSDVCLSNPPIFPHKCQNCGNEKTFRYKYPYQTFRPII